MGGVRKGERGGVGRRKGRGGGGGGGEMRMEGMEGWREGRRREDEGRMEGG